ncbi:preprotein translocase subunit YajC [Criblamydia sequanensis]|uniref:Sec translocon accessory complex subunit YajC n=1 Tax=Candidatus Criblamydia sequanensis CRIB-18 TaxID=1437425 RepID=A0A090D028_9BACT|nr:preprotein translocase subunit YajC [Criblamydia sequanensis]CDR32893.1 Preprotein translocase subunit YajC [Criblamydia sequanensis CRIB-18]
MKNLTVFFLASFFSFANLSAEDLGSQPPTQSVAPMIVTFTIIALFFYFVVLRPEKKRRKIMEDLRKSLKKGDKVIAVGIVGTVDKIEEETVVLKMVDGSKIEVVKAAISEIQSPNTGAEEKQEG